MKRLLTALIIASALVWAAGSASAWVDPDPGSSDFDGGGVLHTDVTAEAKTGTLAIGAAGTGDGGVITLGPGGGLTAQRITSSGATTLTGTTTAGVINASGLVTTTAGLAATSQALGASVCSTGGASCVYMRNVGAGMIWYASDNTTNLMSLNSGTGSLSINGTTVISGVATLASGSAAFITPITQTANTTLGDATTDLLTVNGRITQVAGTPSSYTSGTCGSESGTGDDAHGTITATCTAGQTAIVTFSATYTTAPVCVFSPTEAVSALSALGDAYGVGTATAFTITSLNTSASPATWAWRCDK